MGDKSCQTLCRVGHKPLPSLVDGGCIDNILIKGSDLLSQEDVIVLVLVLLLLLRGRGSIPCFLSLQEVIDFRVPIETFG